MNKVKVFISHSTKDKWIADLFVELFKSGLNFLNEEIFCSSSDGTGINFGDNFIHEITTSISSAELIVSLLTKNFQDSSFVKYELGYAFFNKKQVLPILVPPLILEDVDDLCKNRQICLISNENDINRIYDLVKNISQNTNINRWGNSVKAFLKNFNRSDILNPDNFEEELPPSFFDSEYLKRSIEHRYGYKTGYSVIKYGSSIDNPTANDEDYLVLVHKNYYEYDFNKQVLFGEGGIEISENIDNIDIKVQLYDSFFAALILGKPYEINVAVDGIDIENYRIKDNYFKYYKSLAVKLKYDLEHLLKKMNIDLSVLYNSYQQSFKNNKFSYEIVTKSYDLLCQLLQIKLITEKVKCGIKESDYLFLYNLGKVKVITDTLEGEIKNLFLVFLNYFKKRRKADKLIIEVINFLVNEFKKITI